MFNITESKNRCNTLKLQNGTRKYVDNKKRRILLQLPTLLRSKRRITLNIVMAMIRENVQVQSSFYLYLWLCVILR